MSRHILSRARAFRLVPNLRGRLGPPAFAGVLAMLAPSAGLSGQPVDLTRVQLPERHLNEVLRIGSMNGEWDAFHRVSGARVGRGGDVFILDGGIPAIRVFDAQGVFLRQIGRRGDGPGELRAPVSWGITGERVWIADQRLGRLSIFTLDGELVSDRRLDPTVEGRAGAGVAPIQALPAGGFLAVTPLGPDFQRAQRGRVSFSQHLVRLGQDLTISDTLVTYRLESPAISLGAGGFMALGTLFDGPIVVHAPDQQTITVDRRAAPRSSRKAEFQVNMRSARGTRAVTFQYAPVPTPAAVRDSITNTVVERGRQVGRTRGETQEILDFIALPLNQPPVSNAHLAPNGELWLEREELAGRTRWLVLDRELRPVAYVSAPPGRRPRLTAVVEGGLWAVEEDELGVHRVVRYRIVP